MTSCSTPSNTPQRLKRMISFRNRNTGSVSPPMRYSLSPKTRTKSASTWSLATSTPVGRNKSGNFNRTQSTPKPVGVSKPSETCRMQSPSTPVGVSKPSGINRPQSFSTPISINKSKSINRTQIFATESTDETDSFLMISMSEI